MGSLEGGGGLLKRSVVSRSSPLFPSSINNEREMRVLGNSILFLTLEIETRGLKYTK